MYLLKFSFPTSRDSGFSRISSPMWFCKEASFPSLIIMSPYRPSQTHIETKFPTLLILLKLLILRSCNDDDSRHRNRQALAEALTSAKAIDGKENDPLAGPSAGAAAEAAFAMDFPAWAFTAAAVQH
jgi:hypothetical protein